MARAPKLASFPAIRGALKFYEICATITGIMLLLLLAEMILKYTPLHTELYLGGSGGFLWFAAAVPNEACEWWSLFLPQTNECSFESSGDGINVSLSILVGHGWFYVVYLFACFRIWSLMRWPFPRYLLLALGGVVPFWSFFMEASVARRVKAYLAQREADATARQAAQAQASAGGADAAAQPPASVDNNTAAADPTASLPENATEGTR